MTSVTKNPHPQPKNFFSSPNYKTCCIFWASDRVFNAYRAGEIPVQSQCDPAVSLRTAWITRVRNCLGSLLALAGLLQQQYCEHPSWPWCTQPQITSFLSGAAVLTPAIILWLDAYIVTRCLHPAPADNLPISQAPNLLSFITMEPLSIAHCAMQSRHLLHSAFTCLPSANARCLKSRHPFVPVAQ